MNKNKKIVKLHDSSDFSNITFKGGAKGVVAPPDLRLAVTVEQKLSCTRKANHLVEFTIPAPSPNIFSGYATDCVTLVLSGLIF